MDNKTRYELGDEVVIVSEKTIHFNAEGDMNKFLGEIMTIGAICDGRYEYRMLEDEGNWKWNDEMIDHDKTLLRTERNELYETSLRTMSTHRESYQKDIGMKVYKIDELEEGVEYENEIYSNLTFEKKDGVLWQSTQPQHWLISNISYNRVVELEFTECEFVPEYGDRYSHPEFKNNSGVSGQVWIDDETDRNTRDTVGIYRTRQQAKEKAKELGWL